MRREDRYGTLSKSIANLPHLRNLETNAYCIRGKDLLSISTLENVIYRCAGLADLEALVSGLRRPDHNTGVPLALPLLKKLELLYIKPSGVGVVGASRYLRAILEERGMPKWKCATILLDFRDVFDSEDGCFFGNLLG